MHKIELSQLVAVILFAIVLGIVTGCGDDDDGGGAATDAGSDATTTADSGGGGTDGGSDDASTTADGATLPPDGGGSTDGGIARDSGDLDGSVASVLTMSCEDYGERCSLSEEDLGSCLEGIPCVEVLASPDAVDALADCQATIDCMLSSDDCFGMVAEQVATTASEAYETACMSRRAECADGFNLETCALAGLFHESLLSSATSCLEEECAAIQGCFDGLTPAACQ